MILILKMKFIFQLIFGKPQIKASVSALRNTCRLNWPASVDQHWQISGELDLLDWLRAMFGFQVCSLSRLILLLKTVAVYILDLYIYCIMYILFENVSRKTMSGTKGNIWSCNLPILKQGWRLSLSRLTRHAPHVKPTFVHSERTFLTLWLVYVFSMTTTTKYKPNDLSLCIHS